MNITKDIGDSRFIKMYITRGASFVQSEIEALALEERKDVMKERIAMGQFHDGPNRSDQHMRLEPLILLQQTWVLQESPCRCQRVRRIAHCREPDGRTCGFRCHGPLTPV